MENVTFQERINKKAEQRLLKDLRDASSKLEEVGSLIGHDFKEILRVRDYYGYSNRTEIRIDKGQEIFDKLLPKYVAQVTDEILQKVDEIDWLVNERNNQHQDY